MEHDIIKNTNKNDSVTKAKYQIEQQQKASLCCQLGIKKKIDDSN